MIISTPGETITMIDTEGYSHVITSSTVFATLGIGWAAFILSLLFNILYYALHPSEVTLITLICLQSFLLQVNLFNINEKLVVAVFGYEINLVDRSTRGQTRKIILYILILFCFFLDLEFKIIETKKNEGYEDGDDAGDDDDDDKMYTNLP